MASTTQAERIIHDVKNVLSVLFLNMGKLEKDFGHENLRQPNSTALVDLIQELSDLVDILAQVVLADSMARSDSSSDEIGSRLREAEAQRNQH